MSQGGIRGKAAPERSQEIPRSGGWSFLQEASMATVVGQAGGECQEGRSRKNVSTSF